MLANDKIESIKTFIANARRDGRKADVAWGTGALDAAQGRDADGERFGAHFADYVGGWCRIHGI